MKALEFLCWVQVILIGLFIGVYSWGMGSLLFAMVYLCTYAILILAVYLTLREIKNSQY